MNASFIAFTALGLSLIGFIVQQLRASKSASAAYVSGLETRIERVENELKTAAARVVELEAENLRLMRRLMANGGHG